MNIRELGKRASEEAALRGFEPADWDDPAGLLAKLCLIHSEVSEAVDAVRDNQKAHFREELSDVVIRAVSLAHDLGVHLEQEIEAKLKRNMLRPYMHGKRI